MIDSPHDKSVVLEIHMLYVFFHSFWLRRFFCMIPVHLMVRILLLKNMLALGGDLAHSMSKHVVVLGDDPKAKKKLLRRFLLTTKDQERSIIIMQMGEDGGMSAWKVLTVKK